MPLTFAADSSLRGAAQPGVREDARGKDFDLASVLAARPSTGTLGRA